MKNIVWALEYIKTLSREGFTGKLELNFFQGGVANVNRMESIKAPVEKKSIVHNVNY